MTEVHYMTEPRFHDGISAVLRPAESQGDIEVVVVFGRAAGLPPMMGAEVDAELVDREGKSLPPVSRPEGTLAEAGGMGSSVNAPFRFRMDGRIPAQLKVSYRGETHTFCVREGA